MFIIILYNFIVSLLLSLELWLIAFEVRKNKNNPQVLPLAKTLTRTRVTLHLRDTEIMTA